MKRFVFLAFLLSSTTSLHAMEEDLVELFEGDSSPGLMYKDKARKTLERVNDESLRKLAIKISKLAFPEVSHSRVDTLHYLLVESSITSLPQFQSVFSLLEQKKDSYCTLSYLPRFEKLKSLIKESFPSIKTELHYNTNLVRCHAKYDCIGL